MKKETNLGIWQLLADHGRDEEKVVVMNPDNISTLVILDNGVCKGLVDIDIVDP
jgi:hypothetical protein